MSMSPFCSDHPKGTDEACCACSAARLHYSQARREAESEPNANVPASGPLTLSDEEEAKVAKWVRVRVIGTEARRRVSELSEPIVFSAEEELEIERRARKTAMFNESRRRAHEIQELSLRLPDAADSRVALPRRFFLDRFFGIFKVDRRTRRPQQLELASAEVHVYPRNRFRLGGEGQLLLDPVVGFVVDGGNLASIEVRFPNHYASPSVAGSDAVTSDADKSTVGDATDVRSPLGASVAPSGGDPE